MLELARLYQTFVAVRDSALHSTVMQLLLLQSYVSKTRPKITLTTSVKTRSMEEGVSR